jgi:hypothetical protein
MEYRKPEIVQVVSAVNAIQSILEKGPFMGDSEGQGTHTPTPAYVADE